MKAYKCQVCEYNLDGTERWGRSIEIVAQNAKAAAVQCAEKYAMVGQQSALLKVTWPTGAVSMFVGRLGWTLAPAGYACAP